MKKIKIGVVGCGAIGSRLAEAIKKQFSKTARLTGICDIDSKKAKSLAQSLKSRSFNLEQLIKRSNLIIEATSSLACRDIAPTVIEKGKDIMVMSVGGLIGNEGIFDLAKKKGSSIFIPSGAIAGLDGIKAASLGRIARVNLTTRKSPHSLIGAPYILKKNINLKRIKKEKTLFKGGIKEAIRGFPRNINVAATLSLVTKPEKIIVRIITSPKYRKNSHEIELVGEFGRMNTKTENLPCPDNPKTSYLAILSAIATLRDILEPVKIGT